MNRLNPPQGVLKSDSPSANAAVLELLRFELSRRTRRNPQYSLRSFARSLGVSHTLLSLVLNGHRPPSSAFVEKLVEGLNLPAEKADLIRPPKARLAAERAPQKQAQKQEQAQISLDQFALISDWQHYAILSLLEVSDTEFEPTFIAQRLGISPLLAKVSMQRLVSLGIVAEGPDGRWRQTSKPIVVENSKSTECSRKFQRQLIAKAVDSLVNDPIELRDFSSTTFAMDPKNIPYALKRIREFRRQLTSELETTGKAEEVYNLTVQIFPTSRPTSRRRKS